MWPGVSHTAAGMPGPNPEDLATGKLGFFRYTGTKRACSRMVQHSLAQMDTLGIEPRASRMLSGCDTTTPRALAVTQHTHDLKTKDAGNTEQLVCARQWGWCQILRVAIVPMATRVDVEK